jgi:hypothetical protein
MSTQLYTQAYVYWNGKLLMEHASVTVTRSSGSQAVTTVGRGYAGESLGAPTCEVQVDNAVPVAGFEQNMQDFIETLEPGEIGVLVAGLMMTGKGFIVQDSFKHAVNQESGYSFSYRGGFAKWE